jgi:arsenite methyltransferase
MTTTRDEVRDRYAAAAKDFSAGGCCDSEAADCCSPAFGAGLYAEADADAVDPAVLQASLGCGNPTAMIDLHEGETVLDLGSGAGLDVLLSAQRVGPTGKAYGLDMTPEMLELARANAATAGATNVEFLEGLIEDIPLSDASVDVVISNCVINLSVEKPRVFAELGRVVRPGGRLAISDVVADDRLTLDERAERGSFVGCIAGALSFTEYEELLTANGFVDVSVTPTHAAADGMYGAIVRATRV